jgi:hypothetical protein
MDEVPVEVLRKAVEALRDACGSGGGEVRKACVAALSDSKENGEGDAPLQPFVLACRSKNESVVCAAMDGLQRLLANGLDPQGPAEICGPSTEDEPPQTVIDVLVLVVCEAVSAEEKVQLQVVRTLLTAAISPAGVHDLALLRAVKTSVDVYRDAVSPVCASTASTSLTQVLTLIMQRVERCEAGADADALLLLEACCAIAGQGRDDRSQQLALDLVHTALRSAGPRLRQNTEFLRAVKGSLCLALIKTCVSPSPPIFDLAVKVLLLLVTFKEHMIGEIGIVVEKTFLCILESGNSLFEHKKQVLRALKQLFSDPNTALEIFLNFDCEIEEKNVFELTVLCLCRVVQGKYRAAEFSLLSEEEPVLETCALGTLVGILEGLQTVE